MSIVHMLRDFIVGHDVIARWLTIFLVSGLVFALFQGFLRARKIQPRGFRWKIFRNEAIFATINLLFTGVLLGGLTKTLTHYGLISFDTAPAAWWVIALEYAAYFFAFDAYFYWLHRWMHQPAVYPWVHKIHHYSTSPNLLTTLSVNPLESLINGGFVPLFAAALTVHSSTMALITPTNIIMGLYVHAGYEFFPRWWHRSWLTKWFITTTFHDQHHKYFRYNFGGYTTIWDRLCGTVRPNFEKDFETMKTRLGAPAVAAPVAVMAAAE